MPNPSRLTAIQARVEKATPSERWIAEALLDDNEWNTGVCDCKPGWTGEPCPEVDSEEQAQRDCEFAAHAREDIPWLLSEVTRLRGAVEKYGKHLRECHSNPDGPNADSASCMGGDLCGCDCGLDHALREGEG